MESLPVASGTHGLEPVHPGAPLPGSGARWGSCVGQDWAVGACRSCGPSWGCPKL